MLQFILAIMLQSKADGLMVSSIEPRTLLLGEVQSEEDQQQIEITLIRYAKASQRVVVGEILSVRNVESNLWKDREAEVIVDTWIRGTGGSIQRIFIPYNAPFIEGDWSSIPGKVLRGSSVMIFMDNQGRVLEGNAIFYTDGKYVWRNKRPSLFLNPSHDREWVNQNPYEDYVVIPIDTVNYWLEKQRSALWNRL